MHDSVLSLNICPVCGLELTLRGGYMTSWRTVRVVFLFGNVSNSGRIFAVGMRACHAGYLWAYFSLVSLVFLTIMLTATYVKWTAGLRNATTYLICVESHTSYFIQKLEIQWGPPLWSSGQSSWLQIRRLEFDSRHYQKKK
jgi:hypothetical protein